MRMAMIGVTARGYVAELAVLIGGAQPHYCYRLCCSEGAAFAAKDDTSAHLHDMRSSAGVGKDEKLVHTESAKKRAQRLLKARSWSYRSRVPGRQVVGNLFRYFLSCISRRRKISARRVWGIGGRRVIPPFAPGFPKLWRGRIFQRWRRRMRRVRRDAMAYAMRAEWRGGCGRG
jgi:hypothetical protein